MLTLSRLVGHEGMAWALVTLHSWLIPLYGAAPLLLLPDRINFSMGYSGKSRHVSLQVFCSKISAYKKNEAGGSMPSMYWKMVAMVLCPPVEVVAFHWVWYMMCVKFRCSLGMSKKSWLLHFQKKTELGDCKVTRNVWLDCTAWEKMVSI